jgi:hypothetical protein
MDVGLEESAKTMRASHVCLLMSILGLVVVLAVVPGCDGSSTPGGNSVAAYAGTYQGTWTQTAPPDLAGVEGTVNAVIQPDGTINVSVLFDGVEVLSGQGMISGGGNLDLDVSGAIPGRTFTGAINIVNGQATGSGTWNIENDPGEGTWTVERQ